MRRKLVWLAVVAALALAFWLYGRARPLPVDLARVTRGPISSAVEEEGKTRVRDRYVVSAPVSGRLVRIEWKPGDELERGGIAARIDPLHLQAAVGEAEAQVRALRERAAGVATKPPKPEEVEQAAVAAKQAAAGVAVAEREQESAAAGLALAEQRLERARAELAAQTGPPESVDTAEDEARRARAEQAAASIRVQIAELAAETATLVERVVKARRGDFAWEEAAYREDVAALDARLASLRDDVARTDVPAPVGGRVLRVFEESERWVAAGTPLLEIGDIGALEVEADFLSEDVAHMAVGMRAEVYGRALGDEVARGTIGRIHPSAFTKISTLGVEQQRVKVIVDCSPGGARLGDGYRVEVRVVLDRRNEVTLVPEGALFRREGRWHVFRVEEGTARLAPVRTGLRDGRAREVLEGLAEGDEVILHPGGDLADGAAVESMGG